jgi:hypothetical protein
LATVGCPPVSDQGFGAWASGRLPTAALLDYGISFFKKIYLKNKIEFGSFEELPSILGEWVPFFEACPYIKFSIPHGTWRFHFFGFFLLKLENTWTFISTIEILVS